MDAIERLSSLEDLECGEPQPTSKIKQYESDLGVSFPDAYKKFLSRFGFMTQDGNSVYGISDKKEFDVLEQTNSFRSLSLPDDFLEFPKFCVVVDKYLGGGAYILHCDENRCGEVSLILDETFYEEEQTWKSFETFLADNFI